MSLIIVSPAARSDFICLANVHDGLHSNIEDVSLIVSGEQTSWANGSTIRLALPGKSSPQLDRISTRFMSATAKELQRHWLRLAFSGRAAPPKFFNSTEDLIAFLRKTPGSVGFIEASQEIDSSGLTQIEIM